MQYVAKLENWKTGTNIHTPKTLFGENLPHVSGQLFAVMQFSPWLQLDFSNKPAHVDSSDFVVEIKYNNFGVLLPKKYCFL